MYRQSEKNLLNSNNSSTCPHNMVNFGPLTAEIFWRVWGTLSQISTGFASWLPYCTNVAQRRSTKLCRMFGHLLGWCTIYTFFGALPVTEFCQLQTKITLRPSLAFSYIGSITARHLSSSRQPNLVVWYKEWNHGTLQRAPPMFGWAAITLGIGPHSSILFLFSLQSSC